MATRVIRTPPPSWRRRTAHRARSGIRRRGTARPGAAGAGRARWRRRSHNARLTVVRSWRLSPETGARRSAGGASDGTADELVDTSLEGLGGAVVARGHEDGVVAADGAEDAVETGAVDGARHRLGAGDDGLDDDEVLRGDGGADELADRRLEAVGPGGDRRDRGEIAGDDVAGGGLDEAERGDVAGERRLGDAEAPPPQRVQQLFLRMNGLLADDGHDLLPPPENVAVCMNIHRGEFLCIQDPMSSAGVLNFTRPSLPRRGLHEHSTPPGARVRGRRPFLSAPLRRRPL